MRKIEGFSERLRDAFLRSGMSMQECSRQLHMDRKTFRRYLLEENNPNAYNLARMCGMFGVSADWLLFGGANNDKGRGI